MLDLDKQFATDKDKEVNGVWVPFGRGAEVRIARMNNPEYKAMLRKLAKENRVVFATEDELATEKALEIQQTVAAHTIVKDWKGITAGGQELKYSPETALAIFKKYPDFYERVEQFANDMDLFRVKTEEAALGNSENASSGSSDTAQL